MKGWLLRLHRLCVLAGIVWLLRDQAAWLASRRDAPVTLAQARQIFPGAASLSPADSGNHTQIVRDTSGDAIGSILATSPAADRIVGYSGPSNLAVGLDGSGAIGGVVILSSGDTPEHVAMVEKAQGFFSPFLGWNPQREPAPEIDAVSGATLTSLAMAEAVELRLLGGAPSLRFPEPLSVAEAAAFFPSAAALSGTGSDCLVRDAAGTVLGRLWRTSPDGDNVSGYRGPTECLLAISADGRRVLNVGVRRSFDTPSYVDQVREDPGYLRSFSGRTVESLAGIDFDREGIEGVSGATITSYAVAESIRRRSAAAVAVPAAAAEGNWRWSRRDTTLAAFVAGAVFLSFSPLRGNRRIRIVWQAALVLLLGIAGGDLLSLALLAGWAQHGVPWQGAPGLLLLVAASLGVPWLTRRQLYCHHLCPHGAAQQWIGSLSRKNRTLPATANRWVEKLPGCILAAAVLLLLAGATLNLAAWEPFDAWVFRAGAWISLGLAVAGLAASFFVPQAYCRYGCPTGALLRFLRSTGSRDHFGRRDWTALLLLISAAGLTVWMRR